MEREEMKELFRHFEGEVEQAYNRKNDLKVVKAMLAQLEENTSEEPVEAVLEELLRSSKGKKERHYKLILEFYAYVEEKTGHRIESHLRDYTIIDNPVLRRLDMIRYLQNHKSKTEEIAEKYMLDRRTMSNDLNALESGMEVLGTVFDVDLQRENWNYYTDKSSHPIMLNLDIPEVIAMTIGLMELSKKEALYGPQYRKIAKPIYSGLSEYAKTRIRPLMQRQGVESQFLEEVKLYESQLSYDLLTMLKSGCSGTIKIFHEEKDYIFVDCRLLGEHDDEIQLETRSGLKKCFPVKAVYSCEYHLKREFL